MSTLTDRKKQTKSMILQFMMDHDYTTKAELAAELKMSMPTVINNTNELIADEFVVEAGVLESTGGRKAKRLSLNLDKKYAVGIEISRNHASLVLVNIKGEPVKKYRTRLPFESKMEYYRQLRDILNTFLADQNPEKILGVGFALPGIVHQDQEILWKSHALNLENYNLGMFRECTSYPVHYINDANAALMAELTPGSADTVYLSLNQTLGGSVLSKGHILVGSNRKAGEFGHMILHPGGKKCYCGKCGCSDAYCAASVLTDNGNYPLEQFFEELNKDYKEEKKSKRIQQWKEYLENLAILITNIRMAYDIDVILGGDVGGYLADYHLELGEKLLRYNLFDGDLGYIKYGRYKREAPAIGVANLFFREYIQNVE